MYLNSFSRVLINLILFLQGLLMHLRILMICPKVIFEKQLLNPEGWFVLEHTPRNDYKIFLFIKRERNYGTTVFSIFING